MGVRPSFCPATLRGSLLGVAPWYHYKAAIATLIRIGFAFACATARRIVPCVPMSEHHTWDTTTPNGAADNRGHSAPEALESLVPAPEPAPATPPAPPPLPRRATQLSSDSPPASPLSESSVSKTTSGPQKTGGEIEKPIRGPGNSRGPLKGSPGSKPRNPNKTKGVKARKAERLSRLLPMIVKGMSSSGDGCGCWREQGAGDAGRSDDPG